MTTLLLSLLGAGVGLGLVLMVAGLYGRDPDTTPVFRRPRGGARAWLSPRQRRAQAGRWAAAAVVTALVWLVTGWPVLGVAAGALVVFLPWLFGAGRVAQQRITRLEAVEDWIRRLADVMVAGNVGLLSAIQRSTATVSPLIAQEVSTLVQRLRRGEFADAMYAFANDINDQVGDDAAAGLIMAHQQGAGVSDVLRDLAGKISAEVANRRNAETERAKPRATARTVMLIFLVAILLFSAVADRYLAAYDTPVGQMVLAVLVMLFGLALVWMRQLGLGTLPARYLVSTQPRSGRRS